MGIPLLSGLLVIHATGRTGSLTATVWLLCFRQNWKRTLSPSTGVRPTKYDLMIRT
ncbi:conserved hypothetical phage protein [Citrobacter phage CR44b]|uniref:Conserved hypothetical phage protein n=1 Tax=Citrobacter phage CR44b TaxID=1455075 RepID=A0A024MAB7_9CAUD|nr:hypothetical protein CF82_gp57 [Citrobacter phage CR44b]CDP90352.1 conserved hypothetical phage protein [Citrobacter phage CR44b]